MALELDTIENEPLICTIFGQAGLGKTSLAATFPNPLFIQLERGLKAVKGVAALPQPSGVEQLFEQFQSILKDEHDYQTLVLDSVSAAETMFVEHIVKTDPSNPRSINQACGGYGAGRTAVAGLHRRVRKFAEVLRQQRGMHVVFIAHADVERVDSPDQDPYSKYTLRLDKKSEQPYIDDVDLVGYVKLKTAVIGEEGHKKARSTGERVVVCHSVASNVSKNRLDITQELPFKLGENPFAQYL